jgi:hypothetical protein
MILFTISCKNKEVSHDIQPDLSNDIKNSTTQSCNEFIEKPQITIIPIHSYNNEYWIGERVEVKSNGVDISGDGFGVDIVFSTQMNIESIKNSIKILGTDNWTIDINNINGKSIVNLNCHDAIPNNKYVVLIPKTVKDVLGNCLKNEIKVEISLKEDTKAYYTFVGEENSYVNVGKYDIMDNLDVGSMHLTMSPKEFIVNFTNEVDKESVESSISKGIKDNEAKYRLKWISNKKLHIDIDYLRLNTVYKISMEDAFDKNGNKVIGNLFFETGRANKIGYFDINTKEEKIIEELPDKCYMVWPSPYIEDYIILNDGEYNYIYDLNNKKVSKNLQYNLGIPVNENKSRISWIDSNTLLFYDRSQYSVMRYSIKEDSLEKIINLSPYIDEESFIEMSLSPNKEKVAVVTQADKLNVYVFSIEGELLYSGKQIIRGRYLEIWGYRANLKWYDNNHVIMENMENTNEKRDFNIIRLNVETGEKEILIRKGLKPEVMSGKNILKFEKYEGDLHDKVTFTLYEDGIENELFTDSKYRYSNFYFIDENRIVFNREDDIVLLDTEKKSERILGNGFMIGISLDKSKIYFITNYRLLYFIP